MKFAYSGGWDSPVVVGPAVRNSKLPYNGGVYYPPTSAWYHFRFADLEGKIVEIWEYEEKEDRSSNGHLVAILFAESRSTQFNRFESSDDERLFLFGTGPEILITDFSVMSHYRIPADLLPGGAFYISSIRQVNGWFYLLGSISLRTKIFADFEILDNPYGENLMNVVGFHGCLFEFTRDAVFRMILERGFLDSIEMQNGLHHADWLGWFQVNNEEAGDIYHLLLGDCRVSHVDEQQYWLRTSTLGWIYLYKDWAPWFWRMEDGHWYWLDQDSWPPLAWDFDDQEWEELKP